MLGKPESERERALESEEELNLRVAKIVGQWLQCISSKMILIIEDMVMGGPTCSLTRNIFYAQYLISAVLEKNVHRGTNIPEYQHDYTSRNQTQLDGKSVGQPQFLQHK